MNSVFTTISALSLTVLLPGALTLTILVFRKTGNRAHQLMSVYFATLLLAELFARDAEIRGMIYTLLAKIFHAPSLMTSLCYSTMVIALAELTRYCGGWSKHSLTILFATFFLLWFFCVLMLKTNRRSPNGSIFCRIRCIRWGYRLPCCGGSGAPPRPETSECGGS